MNLIFKIIIIVIFSTIVNARNKGETEISTENGIEVFQNEKYYLLKKNVRIDSDSFTLDADNVKINFDKSLYDIMEFNANGDVDFNSDTYEMSGHGEFLKFEVKKQKIKVEGQNSKLISNDIQMFSDGFIEVNNLNGNFSLKGFNSKLVNEDIVIQAKSIDGIFSDIENKKEITSLKVYDQKIAYIKNNDTEMFAKRINYNNDSAIIELIENVVIIRNDEKIIGDYGSLDTINNSYKIQSKDQSKVKVIIQNNE